LGDGTAASRRYISHFQQFEEHDTCRKALERLMRDLQVEGLKPGSEGASGRQSGKRSGRWFSVEPASREMCGFPHPTVLNPA